MRGGHRPIESTKERPVRLGTARIVASVLPNRGYAMKDATDHAIRFGRIAAMLPVKDMEKAYAFYSKVLGFTKTFENGTPVGFMILERDDAELHLTLQPNYEAVPFNVAHMMVSDVDALYAICRRQGLRIIKGLKDKDYGLRAFVFEDPDGNRIDVGQPL
jgi:catechol 2,3-dioxygenase-like lactoylglutathione lyase family enzyme